MGGRLAVVGGGISGLILADMLRLGEGDHEIFLIEADERCGGLLQSLDCGEFGAFDYGTHLMSESGDEELDEYLTSLLDDEEQHTFRYARRDLAGLYFNGQLQTHTVFPDVTTLDPKTYEACTTDFFAAIQTETEASPANALDYLVSRYGHAVAHEVGAKIVEKLVGVDASLVATMATRLFPLSRMALFDAAQSQQMARTKCPGDRVAYVSQHDIPDDLCSPLAAFYPVKRGVHQYVDAVEKRLRESRVSVLTDCRIQSLKEDDSGTVILNLSNEEQLVVDHVFWTANPLFLAPLLKVDVNYPVMDKPFTTGLVHFLFDSPLNIGDIYYFYCADPQFQTFRVTNYESFCPESDVAGRFALTSEVHLRDSSEDGARLEERALFELTAMGILGKGVQPIFVTHTILQNGFPRPTLANQAELERVSNEIKKEAGEFITLHGVGARRDSFFTIDILRDLFAFLRTYQPSHV